MTVNPLCLFHWVSQNPFIFLYRTQIDYSLWVSSTPLCIHFLIHSFVGHIGNFHALAIMSCAVVNMVFMCHCNIMTSTFSGRSWKRDSWVRWNFYYSFFWGLFRLISLHTAVYLDYRNVLCCNEYCKNPKIVAESPKINSLQNPKMNLFQSPRNTSRMSGEGWDTWRVCKNSQ